MRYIKSILMGIAGSAVAVSLIYGSGLAIGTWLKYRQPPPREAYFVVMHVHFWPTLFLAVLVFAVGFYWRWRRLGTQT